MNKVIQGVERIEDIVIAGDVNGYVGSDRIDYVGVHGVYGF